jgi:hypothetical protein
MVKGLRSINENQYVLKNPYKRGRRKQWPFMILGNVSKYFFEDTLVYGYRQRIHTLHVLLNSGRAKDGIHQPRQGKMTISFGIPDFSVSHKTGAS